jgi:hypothetical protein
MDAGAARKLALALPEAVEAPHFEMASFRVGGKIFATMPPGGERLNLFVGEDIRAPLLAASPDVFEPLHWGAKTVGISVLLAKAGRVRVAGLLRQSWAGKAPKRLQQQ